MNPNMKPATVIKRARRFAKPYRVTDGKGFSLADVDPGDTLSFKSKAKPRAQEALAIGVEALAALQDKLYAQDKWAVLLIFQAMDAAGKDGTIKHVMSGVNPQGCQVFSFKSPSAEDLDHDLRQMVQGREFREDSYYLLNMFPISLPPLRERKEDIPEFVRYFVEHFADSMDKTIDTIPEDTLRSLVRYSWPGNIRELQNYVARGVILATDGVFEPPPPEESAPAPIEISNSAVTLEDKIRQEILTECQRANWKLGGPRGAAARLGLKRTTLFYKMRRLGIMPPTDHLQN